MTILNPVASDILMPMPTCFSQSDSFLGTLDTYRFVLHLLTSIQLPIFAFGSYCILLKTPSAMKSVKFIMLCFHFSSGLTDFAISFVSVPLVYFPVLGGFPMGAVDSPRLQVMGILLGLGVVTASILTIFENRYSVLFGQDTQWQKARKPYLMANYLYVLTLIAPMLAIPDQQEAYESVRQTLPCHLERFIENRPIFIFSLHPLVPVVLTAICTFIFTAQITAFFFILFFKILLRKRSISVISARTHDLQMKFVLALSLQTLLPFALLSVPVTYMVFLIYCNIHSQIHTNLYFCLLSSHGLLSTLIMIFVHQPYRDVITGPFQRSCIRSQRVYSTGVTVNFNMNRTIKN